MRRLPCPPRGEYSLELVTCEQRGGLGLVNDEKLLALGGLLRQARRRCGWTQDELAERAGFGLSVDTISNIERGRHRPHRHTVEQLMIALRLTEAERSKLLEIWHGCARGRNVRGSLRPERRPMGGFLGASPTSRLVARVDELRRINWAVGEAADGLGRLVLLSGEAGIGKTRLAQEAVVQSESRAFAVATGRCYERRTPTPFFPFREALTNLVASIPSAELDISMQRWPLVDHFLLDSVKSPHVAQRSGLGRRHVVFHAVASFIQFLARNQPIAIILDDLHWADPASLELLIYLARHTHGECVFLLGTYCNVGLRPRHSLHGVLRDLIREQLVLQVTLSPLSPEEASRLSRAIAGEHLPDTLLKSIYSLTEGNPFFIHQVLSVIRERADAEHRSVSSVRDITEVPGSVRLLIQHRTEGLSTGAKKVLDEASVIGDSFGFTELQGMGEQGDEELETALDELIATGLIHEWGYDAYAFDHTLTRASIYSELSWRRKRWLNRAAADALAKIPGSNRTGLMADTHQWLQMMDLEPTLRLTVETCDLAAGTFVHATPEMHYPKRAELTGN